MCFCLGRVNGLCASAEEYPFASTTQGGPLAVLSGVPAPEHQSMFLVLFSKKRRALTNFMKNSDGG